MDFEGQIFGFGQDDLGPFNISGMATEDAKFKFSKKYDDSSKGEVEYSGIWEGVRFYGIWNGWAKGEFGEFEIFSKLEEFAGTLKEPLGEHEMRVS